MKDVLALKEWNWYKSQLLELPVFFCGLEHYVTECNTIEPQQYAGEPEKEVAIFTPFKRGPHHHIRDKNYCFWVPMP